MIRQALAALVVISGLPQALIGANPAITEIRLESFTGYSDRAFILTIRSDGTVNYSGSDWVLVKGSRRWHISVEDFQKLARRIETIRFFDLDDQYDRYPLEEPVSSNGDSAEARRMIVTDQPSRVITVVTPKRTKKVEDRMGPPKRLFELEELIIDVTHASEMIAQRTDSHDIPFYESFPLNKKVTYRALLEHYSVGINSKRVAGYLLMFLKNTPLDFNIEAPDEIDLAKYDGCIVDATGRIEKRPNEQYVFVATKIRTVRREFDPMK